MLVGMIERPKSYIRKEELKEGRKEGLNAWL